MRSRLLLGAVLACACAQPAAAQAPETGPEVITETIPGTDISFDLVRIPGGTFYLGSPEDEPGRRGDEGPRKSVTVGGFYMGVYEVTYDEYAYFRYRRRDSEAAAEGIVFDPDIVARPSPPYEDPAHGMGNQGYPASGITQWAALQYAHWLSEKTGEFYRLPTEAEWEYACRAGTAAAYGFGDDAAQLADHAWFIGNSGETLQPPGGKAPNPWGLYDMHGNVAEWTLDEYEEDAYARLEGADPWMPPTRLHPRTVRGGAYDDEPEDLRCAARLESSLTWKRRDPQIPRSMWWNTDSPFVGFRIVKPVNRPDPEQTQSFWDTVLGG